ncbi:hypothetical protein [Acidipropionibacterium timonense]|uniref:hypothetical protein n=1 Tax=Acidipropionibacterium timonense TaxID=2161818 RepID=UPI001030AC3E|nr:hypothetical protein [Acidipropionibacterium timonense]
MSTRRVSLPGASELFRSTAEVEQATSEDDAGVARGQRRRRSSASPRKSDAGEATRRGTGRVRHDEKITVYVSTEELLALENARLRLRARGIAADRGRIVREAIAIVLADLDQRDGESALASRLAT